MADAILLSVAQGMIGKLVSFGIQEIGLWWGVQGELDKLSDTVSTIQAVLLDAAAQEFLNHQDENWVQKLKRAVYEADDLLDDFDTEVRLRQEVSGNRITKELRLFFSSSNQVAYGLSMAHKIKGVRGRVDAFALDRENFHLNVPNVGKGLNSNGIRKTVSSTPEIVVGRDGDKQEFIKRLLGSYDEHVSVLPIVGIGGLGKTTLAQMVFNDEEVKSHFSVRLWVYVSNPFDVEVVVQKILESATLMKVEDLELNTLRIKLEKEIGGKKCLLVLDDVWNEDLKKWGSLMELYRSTIPRGSKIIVTTHSPTVAQITSKLEAYVLKGLSLDDSWSLLLRIVFGEQEPRVPHVVEMGKKIVEKCCGVPLVIKTIGDLLGQKNPETKWPSFLDDELSKVVQNENVVSTLKISYDHLPPPLKHCFAYCALFPKGYKIHVKTLIHLWISQGFIESSDQTQSLEYIGYQYFLKLLGGSFFQDVETNVLGNVVHCKMHDLMHDLATSVSKLKITTIEKPKSEILDRNICHVSFHHQLESLMQIPSYLPVTNSVQTLLLPNQICEYRARREWEESSSQVNFSSPRSLCALDLHNLDLEDVPSSIGNLKHLRYLDVSKNKEMEVLPSSISKLRNLQVLKLEDCKRLKELPVDIGKLSSFRHLLCEGCDSLTYIPRGIGQLTCLQTLTLFIVAKDSSVFEKASGLSELNELNELRRIEIRNLGHREHPTIPEFEAANLKGKKHLESLVLRWNRVDDNDNMDAIFDERTLEILEPHSSLKQIMLDQYGGLTFPNWLSGLMNLIEIKIKECHKCQHLPSLDQLPFLKELYLSELPNLEFVDSEGNGYIDGRETFFPSLEKLSIKYCPNLKGWWKGLSFIESDHDPVTILAELPKFSSLSSLVIAHCPQLSRLPLFTCLDQKLQLIGANLGSLYQHRKMILESPLVCVSSLSRVVEIEIKYTHGYHVLPSFHQIPSLKNLFLYHIDDLEYLSSKGDLYLNGKSGDSTFFPSLKKIDINFCGSLKGWWKDDDNNEDATMATALELPQFPCLSSFAVRECPNFTWVPGLSSLDQSLYLDNASMVTVLMSHLRYPKVGFSSWLPSLVNVVEMDVSNCSECERIPPLDQLHSLQLLSFSLMKDLQYIEFDASRSAFFPSLKNLSIWRCPYLEGWKEIGNCNDYEGDTLHTLGDSLPEFARLSSLDISECPMLISLPLSQTLSEKLSFTTSNLKSFPSNASSLKNLREIYLENLKDLEYIDQAEANQSGGRSRELTFFPFLKELRIKECPNLKGWWKNGKCMANIPQFPQLSVLIIWDCPNLTAFPRFPNLDQLLRLKSCSPCLFPSRLSSFANLQDVELYNLDDLEYIETEGLQIQGAGGSTTLLPSLKKLEIVECPNLKGWWKMSATDVSTTGIQSDFPYFPCLSYLEVRDCPQFTMMPLFPTLEDRLFLKGFSIEILHLTLKMKPVSSVSIYPPLSNLKWLKIDDVADLEYMNCPVFPFLEILEIFNCPDLKGWWGKDAYDLAEVTETFHFPRLSSLEIGNCPMLTSMPLFPSLNYELKLENASIEPLLQTMDMKIKMNGKMKLNLKMKALVMPKSLCCSSSSSSSSKSPHSQAHPLRKLKKMYIMSVADFRALPESWLQNLTSLEELTISDCPNLSSVPRGLQSASLKVEISGCPQLQGV